MLLKGVSECAASEQNFAGAFTGRVKAAEFSDDRVFHQFGSVGNLLCWAITGRAKNNPPIENKFPEPEVFSKALYTIDIGGNDDFNNLTISTTMDQFTNTLQRIITVGRVDRKQRPWREKRIIKGGQRFGKVIQVSIPNRRTKKFNSRFGFICYDNHFSAEEASRKFNGAWYGDHRLIVKPARYERPLYRAHVQTIQKQIASTREWNQPLPRINKHLPNQIKPSYAEALIGGHQAKDFNIKVHAQEGGNEWLFRSVVVRASLPFADQSIRDSFSPEDAGRIQVRAMGGKSYLLTFDSREEMLDRLQNDEAWFSSRFEDAKEWSFWKRDNPCTRAVWINCYGVPLNLWNFNTFESIGNVWGETVSVDESTLSSSSFISGKVLIVTSHFEVINSLVQLVCKGVESNIRVVEEQMINISPDYLDHRDSSEEEDDDSSDDVDSLADKDKNHPVLGGQLATGSPSGHEHHSLVGTPAVSKPPPLRGKLGCQSKFSADVQRLKDVEECINSNFSEVGLFNDPSLNQSVHRSPTPLVEPSPSSLFIKSSHPRSPYQFLSKAHSASTTHTLSGASFESAGPVITNQAHGVEPIHALDQINIPDISLSSSHHPFNHQHCPPSPSLPDQVRDTSPSFVPNSFSNHTKNLNFVPLGSSSNSLQVLVIHSSSVVGMGTYVARLILMKHSLALHVRILKITSTGMAFTTRSRQWLLVSSTSTSCRGLS
ncbi:hypothetical protein LOK49_LG04G03770 [Camellia lanceoleosa]|uniref:Uncharacterized protein n=1 Tax=Camellia lanceoleosa TaxID=1840588 RepID=A0ACC0HY55_9ERIC|nr:hypothetical protein LOK49_LG04G03770 [Camellia lanceoleosa]